MTCTANQTRWSHPATGPESRHDTDTDAIRRETDQYCGQVRRELSWLLQVLQETARRQCESVEDAR